MHVVHNLRYGLRLLRKSPGFTLVTVIALALGIGANSAIFSVVDSVLLRPLPFPEPDRLIILWEKNPAYDLYRMFVSPANFLEWRAQSDSFERMAAVRPGRMSLTGGPGSRIDPEELAVEHVSANLFSVLGVQPVVGRAFLKDEEQPGKNNTVLLSHRLWQRRFGGDRSIPGRKIVLTNQPYTVAGVLPPGFSLLDRTVEAWIPIALNPTDSGSSNRTLIVIGRLRPDASLEQARREMEQIGGRLEIADPKSNRGWRPSLFPLHEQLVGSTRRPLLILSGAVALLLIIACANVANLQLSRAASRYREIAIRTAMGASRAQIVFQLLVESVVLSLAGGLAGLALAWAGIRVLLALAPASLPRLAGTTLNVRVLAFTFAVSVLAGVIFGLAPAIEASKTNLHQGLRDGGRGGTAGRASRTLRNVLVLSEIALAVMVMIGAALLLQSFVRMRSAGPGFDTANLLTARVPLAGGRNSAEDRRIAFFREIVDRAAALPGVRGAAAVNALPLTGLNVGATFTIEGRPLPSPDQKPLALVRSVTPGYFRLMGIPLLAGRYFTLADTGQSPPVAIISHSAARRFWPDGGAIGSHILPELSKRFPVEVVGIVGDVCADRVGSDPWPTLYEPHSQAPAIAMTLVVRTAKATGAMGATLEREVRSLDPLQPVSDVRTMEQVLAGSLSGAKFNASLLAIFASAAYLLAAVGIYGVVSYQVTERTQEIGIRMALGADGSEIRRMILRQGGQLTAAGVVLGLAGAFALTRFMSTLLYEVKPADPATFAGIALGLGAVAMLACYLPSRRASALQPLTALRHE
jgi:putative ABC transport system permease protein